MNQILTAAGSDPLPVRRVEEFEERRTPLALMQREIDGYAWPCLVMNDLMEIMLWNELATWVAELDFAARTPKLYQRQLMRIAAMAHFRDHLQNWDDVIGVMMAMLKTDFEDAETYANALPYYGKLIQDLMNDKEYSAGFSDLMRLWGAVQARPDNSRATFQAQWKLSDGTELLFNCIVAPWNDFDAAYGFDWHPADAQTVRWLRGRAESAAAAQREGGTVSTARPGAAIPAWNELLRLAREKTGFTQADLARAASISAETVYSYEGGRRRPSRPTLLRLARAMVLDGATTNLILAGLGLPAIPSEIGLSVAREPVSDPRYLRERRWEQASRRTRASAGAAYLCGVTRRGRPTPSPPTPGEVRRRPWHGCCHPAMRRVMFGGCDISEVETSLRDCTG